MTDPWLERLARRIVERGLGVPAILVLESSLPITFLANQTLVFFSPLAALLGLRGREYQTLTDLLEERSRVQSLIDLLELLEGER